MRYGRRLDATAKLAMAPLAMALLAMVLFVLAASAQTTQSTPPSLEMRGLPPAEVHLPVSVDLEALRQEDLVRAEQGLPPRFAASLLTALSPDNDGTWSSLDDGTRLWRLEIHSPGAISLNLGFRRFALPPSGRLWVHSLDAATLGPATLANITLGPFTRADMDEHGQLWTAILEGERVLVELIVDAAEAAAVELDLVHIGHGYRTFDEALSKSGSCNVDVVCPEGDGWRDEIRSVARFSVNGAGLCTGFLVNNTAQDQAPLFQTAQHCGVDATSDATVVVYWNYENSTCRVPGSSESGGPGDGPLTQTQSGSMFLAEYFPTDMTLVLLDDDPDDSFNVYWAGWNASPEDFQGAITIHHPNGDEKRISFENDPTSTTSYADGSSPGDGTHIRIADWDVGTTEPGSSGSPLFDPNGRTIGQLHGGAAACGNNQPDWYGRTSRSWEGGGTAATRLRDWLDPLGTGAMQLDGTDGVVPFTLAAQPAQAATCEQVPALFEISVALGSGAPPSGPVTLAVDGLSADFDATFGNDTITVPGMTTLTVAPLATAPAGPETFDVTGTDGTTTQRIPLRLDVVNPSEVPPQNPTLDQPPPGASTGLQPAFRWPSLGDLHTYTLQVALDPGFTQIVAEQDVPALVGGGAVHAQLEHTLDPDTLHYWRLLAQDPCSGPVASAEVWPFNSYGPKGVEKRLSQASFAEERPTVALRDDGSVVTAWQDPGSVLVQGFDATDIAEAPTDDRLSQAFPALDLDPSGAPVLGFNETRFFGDAGAERFGGDPRSHVVPLDFDQDRSDIFVDGAGTTTLIFESFVGDGDGDSVFGQRLDANFNTLGAPFQVNSTQQGHQREPTIAGRALGDSVVVWQGPDPLGSAIFLQRYDAQGVAIGSEQRIAPGALPAAGMADDGSLLLAWQNNSGPGDGWDIYARCYDPAGAPIGPAFFVNTTLADDQTQARMARSGDGSSVVVWQSEGQDTDGLGVYAQALDGQCRRLGGETPINDFTNGDQFDPDVDINSDGEIYYIWASEQQMDPLGDIYARRGTFPDLQAVTALFDGPSGAQIGIPADFTDRSSGGVLSWRWEFGDGSISNQQHPTHTYAGPGDFVVTLTVTDHLTSASSSQTVSVGSSLRPSFSSSPSPAVVDEAVWFTDTTIGGPTSWLWSFGDGTMSTAQHPTHVYTSAGTYDVRLEVSDGFVTGSVQHPVEVRLCANNGESLCLAENRFTVEVQWRNAQNQSGFGQAVAGSNDSGLFWFFDADNWEMLVKVLDGCSINNRFWVFAAATTDVEYTLTVTDELTGATTSYINPLGRRSPAITDTLAFPTCAAIPNATYQPVPRADQASSTWSVTSAVDAQNKDGCTPGPTNFCLQQDRFQVDVTWKDRRGHTGPGFVAPLSTPDSGLFWFFTEDNWEILVKVLDGCAVSNHFWMFAAATTDVELTLLVTDTETGVSKQWVNPLGVAAPAITDTTAFATCP